MNLMTVLPFAHLLGIRNAKVSDRVLKKQPNSKSAKVEKATENKARKPTTKHKISAPITFSHLVGKGSPSYEASRSPFNRAVSPVVSQVAKPKRMTSAEAAKYIVDAGNKARGAGHPRQAFERVAAMINRAKTESPSDIAVQIINAGRKARGEIN